MADENFGQNKKDAKEYYDTQRQIAKVIKQQTESWSTYSDAQKTVSENAKEIRDTQKRINELVKEGTAEAKAEAAELQKQVDYTRQLNKELTKTSVLLKAGGKAIGKWGVEKLISGFDNLLGMYDKMDGSARRATIQMGMSVTRMNQFRHIAAKSASKLAELGIEAEKAGEMQAAFADETGRQVMLSQESLIKMGALAKRTGMAETEMAGLAGQMEAFGLGAMGSANMIEGIADVSDKMGVNTGKVIKKVQQNIGLLNRLNFKGGVAGMAKLAAYSEKYKLSLEGAAGFAEKVMRPEGAIDAAANLQVLGGSLAKLGDPFQLMSQARNDPEEFAKNITKAASATATWNSKLGEFTVSAYEMDRLREASEATGVSLEDLVTTAKQGAKINMFEDSLKVKGDDKEFLSSIMDVDKKGAFVVDVKGDKQYLEKLSASQQQSIADDLAAEKETSVSRAKAAQTTQELVMNQLNALLSTLLPAMAELDDSFRPSIEKFAKWAEKIGDYLMNNPWIAKLIIGLMDFVKILPYLSAILSPLAWLLKGAMLARGFNAGIAKGPLGKGAMASAAGGSDMVKSKSGKMYGADSPQGKMIRTKGGTVPLSGGQSGAASGASPAQTGDAAGKSAGNMLKGAAAILIISAALFVFAKALQEFDKLQNGWQTLAMAAVSLLILSGALYLVGQIMGKATTNILMGSVAILALGVALIPFAYAMSLLTDIGVGTMLGAALALAAFALAAGLMGVFLVPILLGAVAIVVLSGALMLFGLAMQMVAPGMEMFISSLAQLPSLIIPLLLFGPALILAAAGIAVLSGALFLLGAAWFFGGSAFEDLTHSISALKGIDLSGLSSSVKAINSVDMKKLEAIRDLASSLSLVSLFGGIKIEFGDLDVKGTINLKAGSGVSKSTDWVNDPIFVSKLKNLVWESMGKGKKGGKA